MVKLSIFSEVVIFSFFVQSVGGGGVQTINLWCLAVNKFEAD